MPVDASACSHGRRRLPAVTWSVCPLGSRNACGL